MKIWMLSIDKDRFRYLVRADPIAPNEDFIKFDAERLSDKWRAPPVEYFSDPEFYDRPNADFPYLIAGTLTVNRRGLDAIHPLIADRVEVLPYTGEIGEYFALNVLDVLDCLDQNKSDLTRFMMSGDVQKIYKYVFKPKCLREDIHLFKIPEFIIAPIYASDTFKTTVESHGLTGLIFKLVWED